MSILRPDEVCALAGGLSGDKTAEVFLEDLKKVEQTMAKERTKEHTSSTMKGHQNLHLSLIHTRMSSWFGGVTPL